METKYNNNNMHTDSLEIGVEFQDFVIELLANRLGLVLSIFQSKKYQYNMGETVQGVEIKYDARSTGDCTYYENDQTDNVVIEIGEKTNKGNLEFVNSGILRGDNTWIYIVGNYHQIWIFSKKMLLLLYKSGRYREVVTLPTVKNMMLPVLDADKYCAKKITF